MRELRVCADCGRQNTSKVPRQGRPQKAGFGGCWRHPGLFQSAARGWNMLWTPCGSRGYLVAPPNPWFHTLQSYAACYAACKMPRIVVPVGGKLATFTRRARGCPAARGVVAGHTWHARRHVHLTSKSIGAARLTRHTRSGALQRVVTSFTLQAVLCARCRREMSGSALHAVAFAAGRRQTGLAVDACGRPCDCKLA